MKVKIGQVWQDWDARYRNMTPRFLEITNVDEKYAYTKNSPSGKVSRIMLKRFRENSTGYKLITST